MSRGAEFTMRIARRAALAAAASFTVGARAQTTPAIKLGVMTDLSGPFADIAGPGVIAATKLAAQEAMAASGGALKVEVIAADHQNKADIAANLARQWLDRDGVDALIDVTGSSAALAANGIAREKNKVYLATAPGTSELTGAQCSPNTVHWVYDTWMLANATCRPIVASGGDTWFFITADYAFGHAMEADGSSFIERAGGKVLGSARYPFPATTDFSAFLLRAQASKAKVVGLANAGTDLITCVKQASEFGLVKRGQRLAALNLFASEIVALGLNASQGLLCAEVFYWDANDRTRAFTARLKEGQGFAPIPTRVHAGSYAATLHYLKAVQAMGVAAAKASGVDAVQRMKAMPTDDDCFGRGSIRADGRKLHPAFLLQVKTPEESRGPGDICKIIQTIPAEQAFRPLAEGGCPLIKT